MPGEIKHYWVGTTLMVESDAGVSGCDLKGQTGDIGPRGPQGPAGTVLDPDLSGYATKSYVDNAIENAGGGTGGSDIDLSNYATKDYVDSAVDNVDVDLTNYATKTYVSTEIAKAQLEGAEVDLTGFATKDDIANMATKTYVDNAVANAGGGGSYTPTTETWTFTLEDGTTVNKVVCVG